VKRRSFLQLAASQLAIGPVGLGVLQACTPPPPEDWRPLALRAATYFPQEDLESARVVGARFLDAVGREEAPLEAELSATLEGLRTSAPEADREAWRDRNARDFEVLDTRDVGGWVFAATECHLAALVAMFELRAADLEPPA